MMDLDHISSRVEDRRTVLAGVLAALAVSWFVSNVLRSYMRLRHIPGPRLAALSNFVRRSWVKTGDAHEIHSKLHRQYGTVVRVGPNAVMVSQPEAVNKIYGFKIRLEKV